jgi:5-methylcytosine-specific restriction endonuclease McrA
MARGNKYQIPYICVHGIDPVKKCTPCQSAYNMAWQKADRLANPEKYREDDIRRRKNWYAANKAQQLVGTHNWKARKFGVPGELTAEDYERVISQPCIYCGYDKFTEIDHIVPMSKGGSNSIENIQPTCRYCNNAKGYFGEADFLEWLNRLKGSAAIV